MLSSYISYKYPTSDKMSITDDYWVTRQGEKIKISDMTTSHLENTIRFLENSNCHHPKLEKMRNELRSRNLAITGNSIQDQIAEEEMIYFIETSCGYEILDGKDIIESLEKIDYKINIKLEKFLSNKFVSFDKNTEELKKTIINAVKTFDELNVYKAMESNLLINVFSKEWKQFIDLMLGRYSNEKG